MRGAVLIARRDVRVENRAEPKIIEDGDAIIKIVATCICGSDLWDYRGINSHEEPFHVGHEYCGTVEEIGSAVRTIRPGQFVIGSFACSDNTCPHCRAGYQTSCVNRSFVEGCQAEFVRIAQADGTLVALPERPDDRLLPSVMSLSDVMGTGWFAAVSAQVAPGMTVGVVGDGAVGLC